MVDTATPRPWRTISKGYIYATVDGDPNWIIGKTYHAPTELAEDAMDANAALIVRAVNNHDALVAALSGVQVMINCGALEQFDGEPWLERVTAALRAAQGD